MECKRILLFVFLVFFQLVFAQDNRIIKNWTASQVGEISGWGLTAFAILGLDGLNIIQFNSDKEKNQTFIIAGTAVAHLAGNLLLKKQANQDKQTFFKNLVFSSLPVLAYSGIAKPNFKASLSLQENQKNVGFVLISLFVTPIFSTLGNELLNNSILQNNSKYTCDFSPVINSDFKGVAFSLLFR